MGLAAAALSAFCFKFLQTFTQFSHSLLHRSLSSSTGAIWGLSGFLEGGAVLFVEGAKCAAHSFSTARHPRDDPSCSLTEEVKVRRVVPNISVIMTHPT